MLPVSIRRVFLAEHRVDFRRQLDGLLAESYRLGADPYSGDCIVFIKRDRKQMRVIVGDSLGLYLTTRRFDAGRLSQVLAFADAPSSHTISTAELSLLLEGAQYTVHRRTKAWRAC